MRASVRMTRYLESWGAARPFAHLNHRESVSSSETRIPNGRRPKVAGALPPSRTLPGCKMATVGQQRRVDSAPVGVGLPRPLPSPGRGQLQCRLPEAWPVPDTLHWESRT